MDTSKLKGDTPVRTMAGWILNLFMQRGFSFALDSRIEIGQAELVEYFLSQRVNSDEAKLIELIESAVALNAHLLNRSQTPEGVLYWAPKRKLVEFFRTSAATPAPAEKAPAPAAPKVERPAPPPKAAPAKPAMAEKLPITHQYQLAVLQAVHKLGGSAKAADVIDMVPNLMTLPEGHQRAYIRGQAGTSEQPKYVKFVHSARRFLIQQGELESPERGVWTITQAGLQRLKEAGLLE